MVSPSLSRGGAYLTITHALLQEHSYLWFRTIKVLCFSIWYALVHTGTSTHVHSLYKCMRCYPGKQLAHQILHIVLAKCGYFSCSLLVTKDKWVPPRSCPLPFFFQSSLLETTLTTTKDCSEAFSSLPPDSSTNVHSRS